MYRTCIFGWQAQAMRLTQYTDYALRVLTHLALRPGQLATVGAIADGYGISRNHLTKVVHRLGQHGYVMTVRGRGGGIRLARPADRIPVGEVVRRMEEDLVLVECFDRAHDSCRITSACRLKRILGEALNDFLGRLDRYTIATLVAEPQPIADLLGVPLSPPGSARRKRSE